MNIKIGILSCFCFIVLIVKFYYSPDCYYIHNVEITKDKALEMANLWAKKNDKIVIGEPETLYIVA